MALRGYTLSPWSATSHELTSVIQPTFGGTKDPLPYGRRNYDNAVGRHTVKMQSYNEISVVSVPMNGATLCGNSLFSEALDNLGRDMQEEDGGNE